MEIMEELYPPAKDLKVLVLADVDLTSSGKFVEKYIPLGPKFDMIVLCGPLTHMDCDSPEELVVAQARIADVIAQLENVVCRVCYLGSNNEVCIVYNTLHIHHCT